MARPFLPDSMARRHVLDFRLPARQLAFIELCARAEGLSVTAYVRGILLNELRRPKRKYFLSLKANRKLRLRVTADELAFIRERAERVRTTVGRYARLVLAGGRPRARSSLGDTVRAMIYELRSLGANFRQLASVTGDDVWSEWRRRASVVLVRDVVTGGRVRPEELAELIYPINRAGQILNSLAYRANAGKHYTSRDEDRVLNIVADALEELEDLLWQRRPVPTG
jgi:hypothetical protein